uniref:Putative secreted protein n=1 Tax=Amblyomma triste TaxID=251400 RepID=A0A023G1R8_AMBTT
MKIKVLLLAWPFWVCSSPRPLRLLPRLSQKHGLMLKTRSVVKPEARKLRPALEKAAWLLFVARSQLEIIYEVSRLSSDCMAHLEHLLDRTTCDPLVSIFL